MWYAENRKSEVHQNADDEREEKLSLHPESDFLLRTAPQTQHVRLMRLRRDNPQEIIHAGFDDCKIERENDDQYKGEDAAKNPRGGRQWVACYPRERKRFSKTRDNSFGGSG